MSEQITLVYLAEQVSGLQLQLIAIHELLELFVNGEVKRHSSANMGLGTPQVMGANGFSLIRTPIKQQGYLVTKVDAQGDVRDQAFQYTEGDWHRVELSTDGDLLIKEARDAIYLR